MADIDYEIYKYINELADQYIELDDLLEQNGVSYSEALEQAAQFRKQFLCLLEKHAVRNQDLVVICSGKSVAEKVARYPPIEAPITPSLSQNSGNFSRTTFNANRVSCSGTSGLP